MRTVLSKSERETLKAIYRLGGLADDTAGAHTGDLAHALGVSPGTATATIKRLADRGLAEHMPYRGALLTREGRAAAVAAIRDAAKKDPQPRRQWVDVPATAGALWVQAAGAVADGRVTRVADVKLTTDDPAKVATAARAGGSAAPAPAKWIDINLTTQSVVAYEGDWPVFSSLVSTGLPRTPTPPGTYKVFTKLVADDMRGGSVAAGDAYFLPQVPYVMYFLEGGYAIHGTYWHSNFGNPMSRGCVNLTPQNAKWLFDWAALGTTVVVHS